MQNNLKEIIDKSIKLKESITAINTELSELPKKYYEIFMMENPDPSYDLFQGPELNWLSICDKELEEYYGISNVNINKLYLEGIHVYDAQNHVFTDDGEIRDIGLKPKEVITITDTVMHEYSGWRSSAFKKEVLLDEARRLGNSDADIIKIIGACESCYPDLYCSTKEIAKRLSQNGKIVEIYEGRDKITIFTPVGWYSDK